MPRAVAARADVLRVLAEVFREHGYEGASIAFISDATGLGRSSLYHFFPGGKDEMVSSVLVEIDDWFEKNVYAGLRTTDTPSVNIDAMFDAVSVYFQSGCRTCLVGVLALTDARDKFCDAIHSYFVRWVDALASALQRAGRTASEAEALAEEIIGGIQGAIVLSRAVADPAIFERRLTLLRDRVILHNTPV